MTSLADAVRIVLAIKARTSKPIGIVVAGHNGSGKSTMWRDHLVDGFHIPLVNADRMMMSILPEPEADGHLAPWAQALRDTNRDWMGVAQRGVQAFVTQAMDAKVPFAMETVFSHWQPLGDGRFASKIDLIRNMQAAGYFVILFFVGLANAEMSVFRVQTRVSRGGHGIPEATLRSRFPRTQKAVAAAIEIADAAILTDNSFDEVRAFTLCRAQLGPDVVFDVRSGPGPVPRQVDAWMSAVAPW